MANIKSQVKRNRQNPRHEERNKAVRSRLKTEAKKVWSAAETGEPDAASEQLRSTARLLDKAASKGVIHRNTAARRKSKLARASARRG
ncbi:MAG TPA: 30S ribosomal protein S20 [Actinomycetota bacterium]|jgi:small subunit ribosomal protein S20|nr:30S ribosomal protein S20 [Actinomycetota bacterium]